MRPGLHIRRRRHPNRIPLRKAPMAIHIPSVAPVGRNLTGLLPPNATIQRPVEEEKGRPGLPAKKSIFHLNVTKINNGIQRIFNSHSTAGILPAHVYLFREAYLKIAYE